MFSYGYCLSTFVCHIRPKYCLFRMCRVRRVDHFVCNGSSPSILSEHDQCHIFRWFVCPGAKRCKRSVLRWKSGGFAHRSSSSLAFQGHWIRALAFVGLQRRLPTASPPSTTGPSGKKGTIVVQILAGIEAKPSPLKGLGILPIQIFRPSYARLEPRTQCYWLHNDLLRH